MSAWVEHIMKSRLRDRLAVATSRAEIVSQELAPLGVKVRVIGSLSNGKFALHSDVDFLVEECPRDRKYSIESIVESIMLDIPFDVIYQDEIDAV